jgi:hypothetical protein
MEKKMYCKRGRKGEGEKRESSSQISLKIM